MNRRSVFTHFHEILFAIGFKCGYLNFHWVHLGFVIAVLWGRNAANPGNAPSSLRFAKRNRSGSGLLGAKFVVLLIARGNEWAMDGPFVFVLLC
jgi:hypothetical protein